LHPPWRNLVGGSCFGRASPFAVRGAASLRSSYEHKAIAVWHGCQVGVFQNTKLDLVYHRGTESTEVKPFNKEAQGGAGLAVQHSG